MIGQAGSVPLDLYLLNVEKRRPLWNLWLLELSIDGLPCDRIGHNPRRVRSVRERARLWGCSRRVAGQVVALFEDRCRGPKADQQVVEMIQKEAQNGPKADHYSYTAKSSRPTGDRGPLERAPIPYPERARTPLSKPRIPESLRYRQQFGMRDGAGPELIGDLAEEFFKSISHRVEGGP